MKHLKSWLWGTVVLVAVLFATVQAGSILSVSAQESAIAGEKWQLKKASKVLYLNENNPGETEESYDFDFVSLPSGWKDKYSFSWTSSNPAVATVKSGGYTTAASVGTAVISCVITEKATGLFAAEVCAAVSVKENAAKLQISNKQELTTETLHIGDVFSLSCALYNGKGVISTDKQKTVTDYIRFSSDNETVATVDNNGLVSVIGTGTAKITAEAYQSSLYPEATAADGILLTVSEAENPFSVKQLSDHSFRLTFTNPIEKKSLREKLTFSYMLKEAENEWLVVPLPYQTVLESENTVVLTPEMAISDSDRYRFQYGNESCEITASIGEPVTVRILTEALYTDQSIPVMLRFFDQNGIDVTESIQERILFYHLMIVRDDTGSFELIQSNETTDALLLQELSDTSAVGILTSTKPATATLDAYTMVLKKDGTFASLTTQLVVTTIKQPPYDLTQTILDSTIVPNANEPADWSREPNLLYSSESSGGDLLLVKLRDNTGKEITSREINENRYQLGEVTFVSGNTRVLTVTEEGYLNAYATGTAVVTVYYTPQGGTGKREIGKTQVQVLANRIVGSVVLDREYSVVSNTGYPYGETVLDVTVRDINGELMNCFPEITTKTTIRNAYAPEPQIWQVSDGRYQIHFLASEISIAENMHSAAWKYTISAGGVREEFKLYVRDTQTAGIVTYSMDSEDGSSVYDIKTQSEIICMIYQVRNGAKFDTFDQTVEKRPESANNAVVNNYYYTVKKDGVDITDSAAVTALSDGQIIISLTKTEQSMVVNDAYTAITDDIGNTTTAEVWDRTNNGICGAGTYVVTLYRAYSYGTRIAYRTVASREFQAVDTTAQIVFAGKNKDLKASADDPWYQVIDSMLTFTKDKLTWSPEDEAYYLMEVNGRLSYDGDYYFIDTVVFHLYDGEHARYIPYRVEIKDYIQIIP